MISSVNLQEVKENLCLKLKGTGWDDKLKSYLLSDEMDKTLNLLLKEAMDGKRFTPPVKYLFSAFEKCGFDKTEVVFIGQDPYPQLDVADGLAFSCSRQDKAEVSLKSLYDEIKNTVPEEQRDPNPSNDLKRWADQGILLLNSAFTTTISKPGTHQLLWRPFLINVLDALVWNKPGIVYVFLGKKAQEYMDLIPENNYKIAISHPASAGYSGRVWDCEDVFNKINKYLESQSKPKIIW
jgi:uracil-DNA glycosylase